jgi:tRNA pseudouridine38-40 synthase
VIHYYRLTIQYKGTNYLGWQIQPSKMGQTVQGELNKALEIISKAPVKSLGAGRTDAGVHALGQVAKVGIELQIDPGNLLKALNSHLPHDIRVISAERSQEDFHPTIHAKSKEYHYRFTNQRMFTAFQVDMIANQPFELDFEQMQRACKILIGKHDFSNYFCEGTEVSSNIREIYECEILEISQLDAMLPAHFVFKTNGKASYGSYLECCSW